MRASLRWPAPAFFPVAILVAGALLAAGCRSETRPPPSLAPALPAPPPKLAVFDAEGQPLSPGSVVEAIVTESPGERMTIKGELKMTNTGGPVLEPLRSGWRWPREFVPWAADRPAGLPAGHEFAYQVAYANFENLAAALREEKSAVPFHCELQPGLWLPAEIPVEYFIQRVSDAEELVRVRLRLRPQWLVSFLPETSDGGPTVVRRTLTVGEGSDAADVDWVHIYKFVSRNPSSLGLLTGYRYLKARDAYGEPDPEHPLVVTELLPRPAPWPAPRHPPGFSVALPWDLGRYVLPANETSADWNLSFRLGRGSYTPPGRHEIAIEMHSRGLIVNRSSYTIEVPARLPYPNIELLGKSGELLVPGSPLVARVETRPKDAAAVPGAPPLVWLTVPVRVLADGLLPEEEVKEMPADLRWMLLVSDGLLPGGPTAGETELFALGDIRHYSLIECGKLAVLADGQPHDLELRFPLHPKLAEPDPAHPGSWIPRGEHHGRLLAFSARRGPAIGRRMAGGERPERRLFLFERDFKISIPEATRIDPAP